MYTMRLVLHPILGSLHLSGAIARETAVGEWETVATWSETIPPSESSNEDDEIATMLEAIREWSIRTISE